MGTDLQPTTGERDEEDALAQRAAANVSAIAKLKSKFLQWLEILGDQIIGIGFFESSRDIGKNKKATVRG